MRIKFFSVLLFLSVLITISSCNTKKNKSDIAIEFVQDTLNIGYTYWWAESGPFVGNCGNEIALAFTGTLVKIANPNDDPGPLYTAQKGTIAIEAIFKIKELDVNSYANQKFISTDCFYDLGFNIGDNVLVFCYDYEDNYSIPGEKSILKIDSFDAPIVQSFKTYINSDQNSISLKKDKALWATYELGKNLEQIIECAEEMDALK